MKTEVWLQILVACIAVFVAMAGSAVATVPQPMTNAGEDDPIKVELTKAKEAFERALEDEKKRLVEVFGEQESRLEKSKNLNVDQQIKMLDQIKKEREDFAADPTKLPKTKGMAVAVSSYRFAVNVAKKKCEAAFNKAAKDYLAKKDFLSAKAIQEEKGILLNGAKPAPEITLENSVWKGTAVHKSGNVESERWVKLEITKTIGERFEADYQDGSNVSGKVVGKIDDKGSISWNFIAMTGINQEIRRTPVKGKIADQKLDAVWDLATVAGGRPLRITFALTREN
jgi:RNAse (barnase) inhibitor barstar